MVKRLNFFYHLKFKKKFIYWMWKSREEKIKQRYDPIYLHKAIENSNNEINLDEFIERW